MYGYNIVFNYTVQISKKKKIKICLFSLNKIPFVLVFLIFEPIYIVEMHLEFQYQ